MPLRPRRCAAVVRVLLLASVAWAAAVPAPSPHPARGGQPRTNPGGLKAWLMPPSRAFSCAEDVTLFLVLKNTGYENSITVDTFSGLASVLAQSRHLRVFDRRGREKRLQVQFELRQYFRYDFTTLQPGAWVGVPLGLRCDYFALTPGTYTVRVTYASMDQLNLGGTEGLQVWSGEVYAGEARVRIVRAAGRRRR